MVYMVNQCKLRIHVWLYSTEHARFKGKKASPDYSKLLKEAIYKHEILGNVMFNGKLIQASTNYGCFMTVNTGNPESATIPETYRVRYKLCL